MESTDGPSVRPLDARDLDALLALSGAAGWNQTPQDWRFMLTTGQGWAIDDAAGTPVASTVVLPCGGAFAWISMVLVMPQHRGRGLATRLLREALGWLARHGLTPVLDATPAGHPVYRREGFVDTWGFARYERQPGASSAPPAAPPAGTRIEPLGPHHWPGLLALDAPAFGASREPLLRALAARQPSLARVAVRDRAVVGVVLGRDGRVATQVGPLVSADATTAVALLDTALRAAPGRVFADAPDAQRAILEALRERGFVPQRPFTRLVRPAAGAGATAPGDPATVRLVAGPELG
jgi:GNAT superfamily N-acetyltransferase